MNRNIKIIYVALCGVLFLFIFAAFLLPVFFNPKYHKSSVEKYLSSVVGLPCSLGGRVEFSLIPQTSITFTELTVGNPEGFIDDEFLFFKSGQVLMGAWSFFKGQADIKRVMLTGVRAKFEENEQGVKNWSYLTNPSSSLSINLLVVTDGDIVVARKPSKRQYHYSNMSLVLSDYSYNEFSGLETEGLLNELDVRLDGRIKAVDGDASGQTTVICKGNLALRNWGDDLNTTADSSVFIGTISGDLRFPEGLIDLSLTPHAINKAKESVGKEPLVGQLFEIKGSFHEPAFFLDKKSISQELLDQSSIKSEDDTSVNSEINDLARRLNGRRATSKVEHVDKHELEPINYSKNSFGSIKIDVMQIQ